MLRARLPVRRVAKGVSVASSGARRESPVEALRNEPKPDCGQSQMRNEDCDVLELKEG